MELICTHMNFTIKNIQFKANYEQKSAYITGKK